MVDPISSRVSALNIAKPNIAKADIAKTAKTLNPAAINLAPFNVEGANVANVGQAAAPRRSEVARAPVAADRPVRQAAPEISVLYAGRNTVSRAEGVRTGAIDPQPVDKFDLSDLRGAFQQIDVDGDGNLTIEEMQSKLTSEYNSIINDPGKSADQKGLDLQNFLSKQDKAMNIFEMYSENGVLGYEGKKALAQLAQQYINRVDTLA